MKSNEIKDEISINLHPMIKQRYERLTDLLFFLHAVIVALVFCSRSDAKPSGFTGFQVLCAQKNASFPQT